MAKDLEIEGLDELLKALDEAPEMAEPIIVEAMARSVELLRGRLADYPSETIANSPSNPTGRWYERGFGPRWRRKRDSSVGGRQSSEALGRSWTTEVVAEQGEVIGVVGTNVSYAEAVQGDEQAAFHAQRGWLTVDDALEQATPEIMEVFEDALDKFVGEFNKGG